MADVKVILTGDELVELRIILGKLAGRLDDVQVEAAIITCGYAKERTLDELVRYIAERLLLKLS